MGSDHWIQFSWWSKHPLKVVQHVFTCREDVYITGGFKSFFCFFHCKWQSNCLDAHALLYFTVQLARGKPAKPANGIMIPKWSFPKMGVPTPFVDGVSIINHLFEGTPIPGNPQTPRWFRVRGMIWRCWSHPPENQWSATFFRIVSQMYSLLRGKRRSLQKRSPKNCTYTLHTPSNDRGCAHHAYPTCFVCLCVLFFFRKVSSIRGSSQLRSLVYPVFEGSMDRPNCTLYHTYIDKEKSPI